MLYSLSYWEFLCLGAEWGSVSRALSPSDMPSNSKGKEEAVWLADDDELLLLLLLMLLLMMMLLLLSSSPMCVPAIIPTIAKYYYYSYCYYTLLILSINSTAIFISVFFLNLIFFPLIHIFIDFFFWYFFNCSQILDYCHFLLVFLFHYEYNMIYPIKMCISSEMKYWNLIESKFFEILKMKSWNLYWNLENFLII